MSDIDSNVNVPADDIQTGGAVEGEVPGISLSSLNELQADFIAAAVSLQEKNPGVPPNFLMPHVVNTFMTMPYSWIVDQFGNTPDAFVTAMTQAAEGLKAQIALSIAEKQEVIADAANDETAE